MCRSKAEGGRRCPGCAAPSARAAADANGRRRAARTARRLQAEQLPVVPARELPETYWWSKDGSALYASRVRPIQEPDSPLWKPEGGVWAAPALDDSELGAGADDGVGSGAFHTTWTDHLADDRSGSGHLTTLIPRASAVGIRLATQADLDAACERWPLTVTTRSGDQVHGFSYRAMAADGIDVVHVDHGPLLHYGGLLGTWDVPSAVWLRPGRFEAGGRTPTSWSAHYDSEPPPDLHPETLAWLRDLGYY